MGSKKRLGMSLGVASIVALMAGTSASADISNVVFTIRAESASNPAEYAEYSAILADGYRDPTNGDYSWGITQPVEMFTATGVPIARLMGASVFCRDDPQVNLNFSVFAGSVDTVFTITSPTLSFGTLAQAVGRTSAGFTITDLDGNGVFLSDWNGNNVYTSRYNGAVPGGTLFHNSFLGTYGTGTPGDSFSTDDNYPGGGNYVPIADPVSDMSSRFRFTLTSNDIASGTSVYEIVPVPAPSAVTLLGLGGILVARRRR